jgi:hypothetical protein
MRSRRRAAEEYQNSKPQREIGREMRGEEERPLCVPVARR